jgi:hypothetical protein
MRTLIKIFSLEIKNILKMNFIKIFLTYQIIFMDIEYHNKISTYYKYLDKKYFCRNLERNFTIKILVYTLFIY